MQKAQVTEILDFWFSDEIKPKWFMKDIAFDQLIVDKFLILYQDTISSWNGSLDQYKDAESILAAIILFDQFSRNMFRGTKESFGSDGLALELAFKAINHNYDKHLNDSQKSFLYMPFMHSENLIHQRKSVALFSKLNNTSSLEYAKEHKKIILQFGRYPHRNEILGRSSSHEELKFLHSPNSSF